MKNFFAVFKLLMLNTFKRDKNKKGLKGSGMVLGMGILAVVMAAVIIAMSLTLGVYFNSVNLAAEYLGFLFLISMFIVLIFGTVLMVSVMYFTNDISFLLPLPIKTSTVFWAKFAYVYVMELFFAGSIALVGGISFLIAINASVFSYFLLILAVLFIPMLPLILSTLFTMPVIYMSSFFKGKGAISAIILTVGFGVFMFLYMYFINNMSATATETGFEISAAAQKSIADFFNIFIPVGSLTKLILLKEALKNLGLFAASYVLLIFLVVLFSKLIFKRSIQKQLEQTKTKTNTDLKYEKSGIVKSLMKKDFKEIIRNSGLAFYCLMPVILCPVILIAMGMGFNSIEGDEAMTYLMNIIMGIMFVTFFPLGMNYTALSSFTREGGNFYHLKTLPVKYEDQLAAKINIAKIPTFLTILVAGVIFIIFMKVNIFVGLGLTVFSFIFADGYVYYLVYLDLKSPKLVYNSVMTALKNSKNSLLALVVALGLVIPLIIFTPIYIIFLYNLIDKILFWSIFFIIAFAYAFLMNFLFRRLIKINYLNLFEQIEP